MYLCRLIYRKFDYHCIDVCMLTYHMSAALIESYVRERVRKKRGKESARSVVYSSQFSARADVARRCCFHKSGMVPGDPHGTNYGSQVIREQMVRSLIYSYKCTHAQKRHTRATLFCKRDLYSFAKETYVN